MEKYEVMIIIDSILEEEIKKNEIEKINVFFQNKETKIVKFTEWGNRELAYEINYKKNGYYIIYNVETNNAKMSIELNDILRLNKNILRYLIVKEN